ncbi:MAG: SPOR domain-containing protein [Ignavibacteria bacterium]
MNKSELIRKTAKIAGAPEADASLFFEIFIRSAADILNPGDIIQIKDLGFLHYKIAKANVQDRIKNLKAVFPGSGWIDLIIYSESIEKIPGEPIYFVVPAKYELDFAEIDAPFSLSVNKPVIQQVQKKEAYFIPQSYNELVRLLESKAARLIVNAKVIKNENKENEVFIPGTALAEEQTMTFEKPESEPQSEEKNLPEPEKDVITPETAEEPKVEYAPEKKKEEEQLDLKEELPQSTLEEEKLERPAFDEYKKEAIPHVGGEDEERIKDQEQKIEQVSAEELKNEQPAAETGEAQTETTPKDEKGKEETSPSDEREIDKLLSKGSFGANIPWKFDEINIIEPGKRERSQEENAEEEFAEDKNEDQGKELTAVESGEEKTEETATAESIADEKNAGQGEPEKTESVHPEIFDENLTIGAEQEKLSPGDNIGTSEEEKPAGETGMEAESTAEFQNSGELLEPEQMIDETGKEAESQVHVHEQETPGDKRDFSDTEFNEGMIQPEDNYIEPVEKNIEPGPEISGEIKETSEEPEEDKDYETIKPVKLKYNWKEGYLKESEEPPIQEKFEQEEKEEEPEIPDEEGYIEIKPGASKEKIDFLADSDAEDDQDLMHEKIISEEDHAQKDLKEYISKIEEFDKQTSHKRRNTTILAVIVFLLFVGIGVFLYYQYIFKKNDPAPVKSMTVVVKNVKTIERDFEIPVTYPYSKNENKAALFTQPIDSSIIAASQVTSKTITPVQTSETKTAVNLPEPAKLENLGDYIFRQGNDYIVQISSFETQTRAEAQVSNLKKANYDAYVRTDKRTDGKIYYAVMIRGFKSYDQAKTFLK